ncbi:unnamed protein product [Mytilus edulis]|uniref:Uncharacterized protein n=1 Tax=Mytilus edulis TaxID=6550 RepID=A0A8S3QYF1_MYTED|nr:unnamed protein product [Mytilus edulis]
MFHTRIQFPGKHSPFSTYILSNKPEEFKGLKARGVKRLRTGTYFTCKCNENGDITLLGLLQDSHLTIKEITYINGSTVVPNCTFTADQYGHVVINRSCTNDFQEMRHHVIVLGILDAKTVSSTTVSSSQPSIPTRLSTQNTSISSVMSPSTQTTSILLTTLVTPTLSSSVSTQNHPSLSTNSPTAIVYTSSSTSPTSNLLSSLSTILTSQSSTPPTTNHSTLTSTTDQKFLTHY